MELIIIIVIVLLLLAVIPTWPYSRGWGYNPAGLIAAILLIFLVLWLLGVISFNGDADTDVNVLEESVPAAASSGNVYSS
jgi:ATP/ADP translocase